MSALRANLIDAFFTFGAGKPTSLFKLKRQLGLKPHEQSNLSRRLQTFKAKAGYRVKYDSKSRMYSLAAQPTCATKLIDDPTIPGTLRAHVLHIANGRCAMCGKTVAQDFIRLLVDHRVPLSWGGKTDPENLWALCEKCHLQKEKFFSSFSAEIMKQCMVHKETTKRLGELLKAFKGQMVPRSLLEVVGQDDEWTRRLRELRALGWKVEKVLDLTKRGRHQHAYRLISSQPWPESISSVVKTDRKTRRKS